jgi:hypothetical protein
MIAGRYSPPSSAAENFTGIAYLVASVAGLIVAIAVLILVRAKWRHLDAKLDTKLGSIEFAVNGVEQGEDPLIDKVRWLQDCMVVIAEHLRLDLPPSRRRDANARTRASDTRNHHAS